MPAELRVLAAIGPGGIAHLNRSTELNDIEVFPLTATLVECLRPGRNLQLDGLSVEVGKDAASQCRHALGIDPDYCEAVGTGESLVTDGRNRSRQRDLRQVAASGKSIVMNLGDTFPDSEVVRIIRHHRDDFCHVLCQQHLSVEDIITVVTGRYGYRLEPRHTSQCTVGNGCRRLGKDKSVQPSAAIKRLFMFLACKFPNTAGKVRLTSLDQLSIAEIEFRQRTAKHLSVHTASRNLPDGTQVRRVDRSVHLQLGDSFIKRVFDE